MRYEMLAAREREDTEGGRVGPTALRGRLKGVIAFAPTPFAEDDGVDFDALAACVDRLVAHGGPVAVCGAVGEYAALDVEETRTVVRVAADAVAGRVPLIVGIGQATNVAAGLAQTAATCGASGILVNPAWFGEPSDDGIVEHYRRLGAASGLGLIVFSTRGHVYGLTQLLRLAELDAVVGLKDEWGDLRAFAEARARIGDRWAWVNGMAEMQAAEYTVLGADAFTSGIVNIVPELTLAVARAARGEEWQELRGLVDRIRPLATLRARRPGYGVAVIKEAMEDLGLASARVRPPLSPMAPEDRAELRDLLQRFGAMPALAA
jgi:5-dehydro-4-deoxyglucarate dehydratase